MGARAEPSEDRKLAIWIGAISASVMLLVVLIIFLIQVAEGSKDTFTYGPSSISDTYSPIHSDLYDGLLRIVLDADDNPSRSSGDPVHRRIARCETPTKKVVLEGGWEALGFSSADAIVTFESLVNAAVNDLVLLSCIDEITGSDYLSSVRTVVLSESSS